ncbi:MAG: MBL fold metallo-hydrolase [Simkaniaceae bacterium]|nr:MAG: MBL fold metallo-hydrolase [Simkaniaceae bacterium]
MKVKTYNIGYCQQFAKIACKAKPFKKIKFWARTLLLDIPEVGAVLIDTGYSQHFFKATKKFPYRIYRMITPVKLDNQMEKTLKKEKVDYVLLTHFHPDHIGGLKNFPESKWIFLSDGLKNVRGLKGFKALRKGFIPDLLPEQVPVGSIGLESSQFDEFPFSKEFPAVDLFGNQTLFAFELPGHALGQIGVAFQKGMKWILYVADGGWCLEGIRDGSPPNFLGLLVQHDRKQYLETFWKLHHLLKNDKSIEIITTHGNEELSYE